MLLSWLLTNKGNFVELEVFRPSGLPSRILTVMAAFMSMLLIYRTIPAGGWRSWVWVTVSAAILVAGVFAFPVTGIVASASAVAVIIAIFAPIIGAGAGIIVLGVNAAAGSAGGNAIFGIGAAYLVFYQLWSRAVRKLELSLFWLWSWTLLLLYLVLVAVIVVLHGEITDLSDSFFLLLFLGILPLANAPLDWASFGVTRGLLHAIAEEHHGAGLSLFFGVLDLILALLFLLLVGLSTVGGIWLVNAIAVWGGAEQAVALPALWQQLQIGGWRENLWIWAMLGSTLIPTFIHFVVAMFAVALWFPKQKAQWAADKMEQSLKEYEALKKAGKPTDNVIVDHDARRIAVLYISLAKLGVLVVATVLLIVLGGLFFLHLPGFIDAILPGTDIVTGATGG